MNEKEFRNGLFAYFSREGFVKTYKTQLRLAIYKYATSQRDFSFPPFQHSLRSEIICNIIADYLKAYNYRDTLLVFTEETAYHRLSQTDIMRQADISMIENTFLETLITKKRRTSGSRSVGIQTELLSLHDKLLLIDSNIKSARSSIKAVERQRIVRDRLERIRAEKESELQERLRHSFESTKALELSKCKVQSEERFRTEMQRMKAEFDVQYINQVNELKIAREQEEATTRMLQQELDRQLAQLRKEGLPNQEEKESEINITNLKKRCNAKLHKMLNDAQKIIKKRELIKQQIENEKIEYKSTLKKLTQLRQEFASIQV
ncbi:hypothetical protein M9Y10_005435 [Tritrichomonas musculus]|uniref:LisH domain-containing protein n=1 Tax=Tritrichomonas musculus TaxID=1915356 RepID=A0ABR2JLK0_9EUKA